MKTLIITTGIMVMLSMGGYAQRRTTDTNNNNKRSESNAPRDNNRIEQRAPENKNATTRPAPAVERKTQPAQQQPHQRQVQQSNGPRNEQRAQPAQQPQQRQVQQSNGPRTEQRAQPAQQPQQRQVQQSNGPRREQRTQPAQQHRQTQTQQSNGPRMQQRTQPANNNVTIKHNYPASDRRYVRHHAPRQHRPAPIHNIEYRAIHHPYRRPVHVNVVWNHNIYREYSTYYPSMRWKYDYGYRIPTISAYQAGYYIGEVSTVYGRVRDVYYFHETDEFFLYIGDYYPYHDFTIVMPGREAYRFDRRPQYYFVNQDIAVTGLITAFNNQPEIVVKRDNQIRLY